MKFLLARLRDTRLGFSGINQFISLPFADKKYTYKCFKWLSSINPQITSAGKDVEKREPLSTVSGNTDWHSHCGKEYRFLKK